MWEVKCGNDIEIYNNFDAVNDYVTEVCRGSGFYSNEEIYELLNKIKYLVINDFVSVEDRIVEKEMLRVTKILKE
jgi:hypothetical protein